ncbi:TPA: hypothetical protein DDW35_00905 [Candidatus Sumerlaeota bacterium]|nr:hypothetical protein [Candidatus Sumerlaeota bacterium]
MARLQRNGKGGKPTIGHSRPERHSWLMKAGLSKRVKGKKKKAKTGTIRRLLGLQQNTKETSSEIETL